MENQGGDIKERGDGGEVFGYGGGKAGGECLPQLQGERTFLWKGRFFISEAAGEDNNGKGKKSYLSGREKKKLEERR